MPTRRVAIAGGGIIGLAVARTLQQRGFADEVVVFEKEARVATHQTGRNSGVVHAGLYYKPGSLKGRLCVDGLKRLRSYCQSRAIPYEACGKVVVALEEWEEPLLRNIYSRAQANGVPDVRLIGPGELAEVEPHAAGRLALHSPHTAIVDFAAVARSLATDVQEDGGEVRTGVAVRSARPTGPRVAVETAAGVEDFAAFVNCAGLQADALARACGDDPEPRIVPFRGEYYRLRPERRQLVRGLIYPVPDPRYPFLGVHLTKHIDGEVGVGPNAVLALSREGYRWRDVRFRDALDTLRYSGFRRLAGAHWRTGLDEVRRSFSRRRFAEAASRYVPEIQGDDLVREHAGVRAQAVDPDGSLVDDFRISSKGPVVHIRNAPSPAATSSLAIAEHVATEHLLPIFARH